MVAIGGWLGHAVWTARQASHATFGASAAATPQDLPDLAPAPETGPEVETAAGAAPASPDRLPQVGEAFIDRFDGEFGDRWTISDGWSNGAWMASEWSKSEVEVRPDLLTLSVRKAPTGAKNPLLSGEIQSHDQHRYGYFEARMKTPRDPGLVMALFTYAGFESGQRPNEIDIEILGRNPRVAELTIHENGKATAKKIRLPFDASEGFHTWGFDWQPDHVRWYVDGRMIHEETGAAARRLVRPQQMIVSIWASETLHKWVGKLDIDKAPWRLEVSCAAYAATYAGPICPYRQVPETPA